MDTKPFLEKLILVVITFTKLIGVIVPSMSSNNTLTPSRNDSASSRDLFFGCGMFIFDD